MLVRRDAANGYTRGNELYPTVPVGHPRRPAGSPSRAGICDRPDAFQAYAFAPANPETSMADVRLSGIEACVFDAYGTLFDVNSAAAQAKDELGDQWQPLAELAKL